MEKKIYKIDNSHSNIGFNVKHMMFSKVNGNFNDYEATVEMAGEDFENAVLQFEADASSINTNNEERDKHLRSADFFNAENNAKLHFKSTEIQKKGEKSYVVKGELTMNGQAHLIELNVEYSGIMQDPWGNDRIALVMNAEIDRKDWGINWNQALETGGVMVSKKVNFDINAQFV